MHSENNHNTTVKKRQVSWGFRLLAIFFALILVLVLANLFYRSYLDRCIEQRLQKIRNAGFPVTRKDLNDWYTRPDTENAADLYWQAFDQFDIGNREQLDEWPFFGSTDPPPPGQPFDPDTRKKIESLLADNAQALELLHQAAAIPDCRYPIDLTKAFDCPLPHISEINMGAKLLHLQAMIQIRDRQIAPAIQTITDLFALAYSLDNEPAPISSLVLFAVRDHAINSIQDLLCCEALTENHIKKLAALLTDPNDQHLLIRAYAAEQCIWNEFFEDPVPYHSILDLLHPELLNLYKAIGGAKREQLIYLNYMDEFFKIFDLPLHQRPRMAGRLKTKLQKLCQNTVLLKHVANLNHIFILYNQNIARIRSVQTTVAVERYRLQHNRLPESLNELVPDLLDAVQIDPFDGRPLRYQKRPPGYCLYSVGEDQIDNAGRDYDHKNRRDRNNTDICFIVSR